jgi:hypothetical protein
LSQVGLYTDEMKQFVQDHLDDDPAQLLLGYLGKVDFDLKFAVQQINARQKVKSKVPSWYKNRNLIFPVSLSIEQASSELTGRYKVGLVSGGKMVDLTGGLGVDSYFLSQKFQTAVYCEQNKDLFDITKHNLKVLSPDKFEFVLGDSMTWFIQQQEVFDLVFIDPARRGEGNRKLYRLEDCEPDIVGQWDGLKSKSKAILVKASPMLDLKLALGSLQDLAKIMVLSVKNEVKEVLLFWSLESVGSSPRIEAVDIRNEASIAFSFTFGEEENSSNKIAEEVGQFLYEPNAAILKAGAFKIFGHRFGLGKIHPNSHFFTGNKFVGQIPGRVFEILSEINQPKKEIKKFFPSGKANVLTRNYSMSADELKRKFRLKDGGEDFLIGSQTAKGFQLWHCRRVNGESE